MPFLPSRSFIWSLDERGWDKPRKTPKGAYGWYSLRPVTDCIDREVLAGESRITLRSVSGKYRVHPEYVKLAIIVMANSERLDERFDSEGQYFVPTELYKEYLSDPERKTMPDEWIIPRRS